MATELGLEPIAMAGRGPTVRNPIQMSATPARYDLAPPGLDEHGEVIRAWLGLPVAEHRSSGGREPAVPSA
jgi:crotonobetainyl-CoA:carnitine CoA-transferase CaiB-like acyl-CoA transferase